MIVLGVDPGTAVTGYGVVVREGGGAVSLVECGVIRTDEKAELAARLRTVHEGLLDVIRRVRPARVAVEGVFYGQNVRSTVVLGHTRGAILLAAALCDLPVAEYSPAEIKNAVCGTGRATKEQVQFMVQRLLKLKDVPKPADAADGLAAALCEAQAAGLREGALRAEGSLRSQGALRAQGGLRPQGDLRSQGGALRAQVQAEAQAKAEAEKRGRAGGGVGRFLPDEELPVVRRKAGGA